MNKIKLAICLIWCISLGWVVLFRSSTETKSQNAAKHKTVEREMQTPNDAIIEKLDASIQNRFLTEPSFGMARIVVVPLGPTPLRSAHLNSFSPRNKEEIDAVKFFETEDWDVGLYLFGRTALPDEKKPERFKIRFRANEPVGISHGLNTKKLPDRKKMLKEIRDAFIFFQEKEPGSEVNYKFEKGKWAFIAKPVRAANESCLKCHSDYVITEKLENDQFKFRKRKVGDVNGVIVYAFSKRDGNK